MKAFLWRIVYAAFAVVVFWLIFPLFMEVVGFPPGGPLIALMRICIACIAVAYVLFAPPPPMPF
jgi:hypothetical protein